MKKILYVAGVVIISSLAVIGVLYAATTIGTSVTTGGNLTVGNGTPGVTQDGEDAYIEGTLEVDGASQFDGALTVNGASTFSTNATFVSASTTGTVTLGDAATDRTVLNGRLSTVNAAGSALDITSAYAYGEGMELRYTVSEWPTGQGNFQGIIMKVRNNAAGSQGLRGIEVEGSASNVTMNNLEGGYFYAYQRGGTARSVGTMYGVTAELMFDDDSDVTFATSSAAYRGIVKTDNTMVNEETKLQGIDLVFGTADGVAGTIFAGINLRDDSDTTGDVTLKYGLKMNDLATTISVADIVLSNGDTIHNTAASSTNVSGKFGVATTSPSSLLSVGTGGASASTTLDFSKFCIQGDASDGTRYHMYFTNAGTVGIAAGNCP